MACQIRYLNSAGIHRREIPGIDALARSLPAHWLVYASLQHYPAREPPIELDAMVVMPDRILLLEIKDWNGALELNGDNWKVGGIPRGRSPVDIASGKARKLATVLSESIAGFAGTYVDSAVILTGAMQLDSLPEEQRRRVLTLQQASDLGSESGRLLLKPAKLRLEGPIALKEAFDRVTGNPRKWGPLEAIWDGYRVAEEDFFVHPREVWREHRAELARDGRLKAVLRVWDLDRLPPALNAQHVRRLVVDQEIRVIGHLMSTRSRLADGGLLMPTGGSPAEVLTQHYELRSVQQHWTTLDRWLERTREELDPDDRITAATTLLAALSDLHSAGIAHRDLGFRSIWAGSPTELALSSFACSHMPGDPGDEGRLEFLRGYSPDLPEGPHAAQDGSWMRGDVYAAGLLVVSVLGCEPPPGKADALPAIEAFPHLADWFGKALAQAPGDRFRDVIEAAGEFASAVERRPGAKADVTVLDTAESPDNPYLAFRQSRDLAADSRRHTYVSIGEGGAERVVKVWVGARRGSSVEADTAMSRLFDGIGRLRGSRIAGVPDYVRASLSPVGPFVAYAFEDGEPLAGTGPQPPGQALRLAQGLVDCLSRLHALGLSHGDVSGTRILVKPQGAGFSLLGLFDIPGKGPGRPRDARRLPPGWRSLTAQHLDRYAALAVVADMLELTGEERLCGVVANLRKEAGRPAVETLDVAASAIRASIAEAEEARAPSFAVGVPAGPTGDLGADGGKHYVRLRQLAGGRVEYKISGLLRELTLVCHGSAVEHARASDLNYAGLSQATARGIPAAFALTLSRSDVSMAPGLPEFAAGLFDVPGQERPGASKERAFDVRRYWARMLEAEESMRPMVEIGAVLREGPTAAYAYERVSGSFDFDPGSTVEVFSGSRKAGTLDLDQSDERAIAVRLSGRPLAAGDRVVLADLRERTSLDRRRKAVQRVLRDEAAIGGLLDYLSSAGSEAGFDVEAGISRAEMDAYGLNDGQREAFAHVLRKGPVGLLQGPPGTGKTRFIAALVHWLSTRGGARRILVASQSHEGVNNAIEAIVDVYRRVGGRPSLVRIGSKGITDKIRPFHTAALRERLAVRFQAAFGSRAVALGGALGLTRELVAGAVEIESRLGAAGRHLQAVAEANGTAAAARQGRRSDKAELRAAEAAYRKAAGLPPGAAVDPGILQRPPR